VSELELGCAECNRPLGTRLGRCRGCGGYSAHTAPRWLCPHCELEAVRGGRPLGARARQRPAPLPATPPAAWPGWQWWGEWERGMVLGSREWHALGRKRQRAYRHFARRVYGG